MLVIFDLVEGRQLLTMKGTGNDVYLYLSRYGGAWMSVIELLISE